jgi:hypothetical protein
LGENWTNLWFVSVKKQEIRCAPTATDKSVALNPANRSVFGGYNVLIFLTRTVPVRLPVKVLDTPSICYIIM